MKRQTKPSEGVGGGVTGRGRVRRPVVRRNSGKEVDRKVLHHGREKSGEDDKK